MSNTNTSTQEEDMKLPVWKKTRFVVGIFLMLVFIGSMVALVSFAAPSSKEADEDQSSNVLRSGNIRGTTMNSSDTQRSQVTSRRSGLPPVVEDKTETLPTDDSAQNSSIGTNITNANTDPWDIDEQDQYADPSGLDIGDYYSSRDGSWNNDGYKSDDEP